MMVISKKHSTDLRRMVRLDGETQTYVDADEHYNRYGTALRKGNCHLAARKLHYPTEQREWRGWLRPNLGASS